jgi:hypothetical protein
MAALHRAVRKCEPAIEQPAPERTVRGLPQPGGEDDGVVVQDRHPRTVPGPQRRAVLFRFTVLAGIWAGLVGLLVGPASSWSTRLRSLISMITSRGPS